MRQLPRFTAVIALALTIAALAMPAPAQLATQPASRPVQIVRSYILGPVTQDGQLSTLVMAEPKRDPADTGKPVYTCSRSTTKQAAPAWLTGDKLHFVVLGDSRSHPDVWDKVVTAALEQKPQFAMMLGDYVQNGQKDEQWDEMFLTPTAKKFLGTVPIYSVIGNHENNAPFYDKLFTAPGKDPEAHEWSQTIGPALMVGMDGAKGWSAGGEKAKWLEKTLAEGDNAKYIFVFSHYPPYVSGPHGTMKLGVTIDPTVRAAKDVILPILEKHKITAFIVGHEHCYERTVVPSGLTIITAGGAGAELREKTKDAAKQNPYSKLYFAEHHFCVVDVNGEKAVLRAITPGGKELDKVELSARKATVLSAAK